MKEIELTQNKVSLVDDQDYTWLIKFKWCAHKDYNMWYARTNIKCLNEKWASIGMHVLILDRMLGYEESNLVSDHIDRNGLNNQRHNLRRVAHRINMHNRLPCGVSKYRGVSWHKPSNKWQSLVKTKGICTHLGYFDDEEEAAKVFDRAVKKIYSRNVILNFK